MWNYLIPPTLNVRLEPFYTKKAMGRSGTGLGMAVVWGTVRDHQGYIDVQSMEGKGTSFHIFLPACRQHSPLQQARLSNEDHKGRGESVLVVDDIKEQRAIATGILTKNVSAIFKYPVGR